MEEKVKKSRLARIPAWALSLITFFVSIVPFIIVNDPQSTDFETIDILVWIFYIILVTIACFFICKTHPKSVWYTPVICNGVAMIGLIASIFLTIIMTIAGKDYETTSTEWILIVCSIVLSVTAAILGAKIGKRRLDQAA